MADDYNSPFGSSPFGGFNQPRPQEQPAFNPTPVQQPAASQPAPAAQPPVESNANNEDKPADGTKKNKGGRPKKNARPSNQITREVVDRILTINDLLNSIDERTLGLLKAVSEIHPMASRSNVIAGLSVPARKPWLRRTSRMNVTSLIILMIRSQSHLHSQRFPVMNARNIGIVCFHVNRMQPLRSLRMIMACSRRHGRMSVRNQ